MMTSIHELLQKEAQAVLNIPITDAYEKAVELIVEQIHLSLIHIWYKMFQYILPLFTVFGIDTQCFAGINGVE